MNQFLVQILGKKSWGKNQLLTVFTFPHDLLGQELVQTYGSKTNLGTSQVLSNFLDVMAAKYKLTGLVIQFRILMLEETSMVSRNTVQSIYRRVWESHKDHLREDISLWLAVKNVIANQGLCLLNSNSNNQVVDNFTVALLNTLLAREFNK